MSATIHLFATDTISLHQAARQVHRDATQVARHVGRLLHRSLERLESRWMSSAEWLTGRDARNLLLSVGPLDARIGAKLFRLAADGMVRTRAKVVFVNETAQSRDVDISATLWAQLLTGAPIREDWVLSSFAGRRARRLLDEDDVVRLGGVTFSAIDLKASLGLEVIEISR